MTSGLKNGKRGAMAVAVFVATFFISSQAFASCTAFAGHQDATITPKGKYYVSFKVQGKPCADGCRGHVQYRFHVTDKNGRSTWDRHSVSWSSEAGEPTVVSKDSYYSYCNEGSLGPCEVQHVQVLDASYFD